VFTKVEEDFFTLEIGDHRVNNYTKFEEEYLNTDFFADDGGKFYEFYTEDLYYKAVESAVITKKGIQEFNKDDMGMI
jgi:hypothetical protein